MGTPVTLVIVLLTLSLITLGIQGIGAFCRVYVDTARLRRDIAKKIAPMAVK